MSALFQNVLTASFHGSIVILAVLVLRLILRKAAPKKYLCYLWVLAGLRLLMPFDIQSDLSLQPQAPPETVIRWEQPASMWKSIPDTPVETLPEGQAPAAPEADGTPEAAPETAPGSTGVSLSRLLPFLWIGVAAVFLGYNLYCYFALRKKVRQAKKIPGGWEADGIETAFILGFVKPQIYIPTGMSPETQKYILAHERTHLDKADHWIKMLGFLALAIHWFNPLVWVAYILLCKDIEMACDERVVQFMELPERKEYSTALLNCSSSHVHYAASPVAFGEVNVKNRIQSILNYRSPSFWSGLLSVIAIIFVTVCLVTNPTRQDAGDEVDSAPREFAVATQPPMDENPDWGVSIIADVQSPTTMNLYLGVGVDGTAWDGVPVYKEKNYTLEAWNGETWEPLPVLAPAAKDANTWACTLGTDSAPGSYMPESLNWSTLYGALPEGDYRIVLTMTRPGEKRPFYAWFHIYANALTGEEAEAYAKVESALEALQQSSYYTATISESSSQGTLLTTSVISRSYSGRVNINFYTGEFCYSSYTCLPNESPAASWTDAFYPMEDAYISFSEKEGKISDQELCLTASRVDGQNNLTRDICTYTLGDDGKLTGVDILRQSTGSDGAVTQSRRAVSVVYSSTYYDQEDPAPKNSFEAAQDSPWNLFFRVDDDLLAPTSGDVLMALGGNHVGVSNYSTDGHYWLEKRNDSGWDKLEPSKEDPAWSDETYRLKNNTTAVQVDWSEYYGSLEPGLYRMGKRFYNGEESIIQYAEFQVYPTGGIYGAGGQEAIDRVRAAIEKVRAGNYCVSQATLVSSPMPRTILCYTFWKSDEICVTDYYDNSSGDYRHSSITTEDDRNADLFYDEWVKDLDLDQPNFQIYFPTGDSSIRDREISFTGTYTTTSLDDLLRYTVLFDENGELLSITVRRDGTNFQGWIRIYTIEDRPESEIKAHVEQVMAEHE